MHFPHHFFTFFFSLFYFFIKCFSICLSFAFGLASGWPSSAQPGPARPGLARLSSAQLGPPRPSLVWACSFCFAFWELLSFAQLATQFSNCLTLAILLPTWILNGVYSLFSANFCSNTFEIFYVICLCLNEGGLHIVQCTLYALCHFFAKIFTYILAR